MRISENEQSDTDFDWFCVDDHGNVGHFASAGFKALPSTVAESAEGLRFLGEFFGGLNAMPEAYELVEHLEPKHRTERYLRGFVAMATRGLYSFDIGSYLEPGICHFRIALPESPLRFADLSETVQGVLGRTVLKNCSLERCSSIPYIDTLSI